jgi:very-short-patch-repair endonuclease
MTIHAPFTPGFRSHWEDLLGRCESPIESIFLERFCTAAIEHGYEIGKFTSDSSTIAVKPQKPILSLRIDFGISFDFLQNFTSGLLIAVECDGHDWHDLTKEQAVRDRQRDRYLQRCGYKILRFTGSELYAHPLLCALEVLQYVMDFQTGCFCEAIKSANQRAVPR